MCSGEVGGAKDAVEQAVTNAMEKEEELGVPRCDVPWVQEVDNDEIAVDAVSFQPCFLVQDSSSPIARISPSCVSLGIFCAGPTGFP